MRAMERGRPSGRLGSWRNAGQLPTVLLWTRRYDVLDEQRDDLFEDLDELLTRHVGRMNEDLLRAGDGDADLVGELRGLIEFALMIWRRVGDGASILQQVLDSRDLTAERTSREDLVDLIVVLTAAAELSRRARETASPVWDLA